MKKIDRERENIQQKEHQNIENEMKTCNENKFLLFYMCHNGTYTLL